MKENNNDNFDKVVNEIFLPVIEECRDDIETILESNQTLKEKLEIEVKSIIAKRLLKE